MPRLRFSGNRQVASLTLIQLFFTLPKECQVTALRLHRGVGVGVRVLSIAGHVRILPPYLTRIATAAILASGLVAASPAMARQHPARAEPAYSGPTWEAILVDAETGQVLRELNADRPTYPASLTKMMTLYLTFEALNQGRIRLDTPFTVSSYAASRAPSKLALEPGETVRAQELILGVVTKSANDAATVLAEGLGGSEANFAQMMTAKAHQLGMQQTFYRNASGLPDPDQRTTARDIARLALALYHSFPREYRYFATREFYFRGELVRSHNHLLDWYPGADGIKTGFINDSGFNLAASAVRNGHRLIGVIMGGRTWRERDRQMGALLDQGFADIAGNPGQRNAAPAVAATAPAQNSAPPQTAAPAQPVATAQAQGSADPPVERGRKQSVASVASAALRHLAPVGKAEASTLAHDSPGAGEDWSIQLGAFHGKAAAEQVARKIAHIAAVRGKPAQIIPPGKSERLYRARLLHFSGRAAQAACAELRKQGVACSVINPGRA
jgi:D-alanyl-D-alanine carboxypeptidase